MALTQHPGAEPGSIDITLSLPAEHVSALGIEARDVLEWTDTALGALALLRAGELPAEQRDALAVVIEHLGQRLLPRLEGIRDAAIRAHAAAGGSYGELAAALNLARSTAQYRRDVLVSSEPGEWEQWATRPIEKKRKRTR